MKRLAALFLAVALSTVIVLPVASHVNHPSSNRVLTADGTAPPPPVPPHAA
jgi:hypothetical protein